MENVMGCEVECRENKVTREEGAYNKRKVIWRYYKVAWCRKQKKGVGKNNPTSIGNEPLADQT